MKKTIIAIPRGRIIEEFQNILNKTTFAPDPLLFDEYSRSLTFSSKDKNIDYIKVRSFDVCTFVAFGAAQIGIAGEDVIKEFNYSEIYAPLNLNIGHCRLSVAALTSLLEKENPPVTQEYLTALTVAHGMVKIALERPDLIYDEGIDALQNPSKNNLVDIRDIIESKKRKLN